MKGSNRCPECGGIAPHTLTDIDGRRYYHCHNGLTTFKILGDEISRVSRIVPCDTILDQHGRKFTGVVAYASEGEIKSLSVTDGKERR